MQQQQQQQQEQEQPLQGMQQQDYQEQGHQQQQQLHQQDQRQFLQGLQQQQQPIQGMQQQGHQEQGQQQQQQQGNQQAPPDLIDWRSEVVLNVTIHAAMKRNVVADEFLVLGSQPLTALHDHLHCLAGAHLHAVGGEGSGAAYFYAEGCFYNDTRRPNAEDLSAPIKELFRSKGVLPTHFFSHGGMKVACEGLKEAGAEEEGNLRTANMQDTTFNQLALRLTNFPSYIFCHLGCCEHLIEVRDVRAASPNDPQSRAAYPVALIPRGGFGMGAHRRCDICDANPAAKVAYDDPLGMLNPTLYCTRCFLMLHPSGQALPPATVFPYIRYDDGGVEEEPGMEGVGQ
mmetsp:Transcript_12865/g.35058  ORF Transcript_12865/g.35058 Transcript_12865/m.35058 type:complete len:343 (+) Transcript_12865:2-1030(+)